MHPALQGIITIIIGVGGCLGYFYLSNQLLDKVIFPPRHDDAGRNINRANMVQTLVVSVSGNFCTRTLSCLSRF